MSNSLYIFKAFGNHEFDDGMAGLVPFLEAATFPIIACNIDASKEPTMQGKFRKSVVVEYEGRKVGIIGYTTTETKVSIKSLISLVFIINIYAFTVKFCVIGNLKTW